MQYQGFVNRIITCRAVVLAVALVFGASCRRAAEQNPPPDYNVVLISVDTLRADRLNCYGYKERKVSPNIDALAAQGILFENHITACPWTTPAATPRRPAAWPPSAGA